MLFVISLYINDIIYITFYIIYFKKLGKINFKYYRQIKIIYFISINDHNTFNDNLYYWIYKFNYIFDKILVLLFFFIYINCDFTFRNLKSITEMM